MTASQSVSPSAALNCAKSQVPLTQRGSENSAPSTKVACDTQGDASGAGSALARHRASSPCPRRRPRWTARRQLPRRRSQTACLHAQGGQACFSSCPTLRGGGRAARQGAGPNNLPYQPGGTPHAPPATTRSGATGRRGTRELRMGDRRRRQGQEGGQQIKCRVSGLTWCRSREAPSACHGDMGGAVTGQAAGCTGGGAPPPGGPGPHSWFSLPSDTPLLSRPHLDGTTLPAVGMADFVTGTATCSCLSAMTSRAASGPPPSPPPPLPPPYGSFQLDTKVDFRFPGIELAS